MISRILLFLGQVIYLYRGSSFGLSLIEKARQRTARQESRKRDYQEGLGVKAQASAAKANAAKAGQTR